MCVRITEDKRQRGIKVEEERNEETKRSEKIKWIKVKRAEIVSLIKWTREVCPEQMCCTRRFQFVGNKLKKT